MARRHVPARNLILGAPLAFVAMPAAMIAKRENGRVMRLSSLGCAAGASLNTMQGAARFRLSPIPGRRQRTPRWD